MSLSSVPTGSPGQQGHCYCSTSERPWSSVGFIWTVFTSPDAGVFLIVPEVVWRRFRMVARCFFEWSSNGLSAETSWALHLCEATCPWRPLRRQRPVETDASSPSVVPLPWFHACFNVEMCAPTSVRHACLLSGKDVLTTSLISYSVLSFVDNYVLVILPVLALDSK